MNNGMPANEGMEEKPEETPAEETPAEGGEAQM